MDTLQAVPGKIQMIGGDGEFLYDEAQSLVGKLKKPSSNASSPYMVISIIGPQSSGKSYFLNTLFRTKFNVMDATTGRKQTTKGVWVAICNDPSMIIMDVEGCDGQERGEDNTFERRSALFSLTVSDVLLLNMSFNDIGRYNGANHDLIKLIFEERVKIEGQKKTTIIILIRDYDYAEDPGKNMKKLWETVHSATTNRKMSDYVEVIVQDMPNYRDQKFSQKCKEVGEFLCKFAANGSLQETDPSSFAYSSKRLWDLICANKRLSFVDHKLAMSNHVCRRTKDEILNSFNKETGNGPLLSYKSMSVIEFNQKLPLFLKEIFARYEDETKSFDKDIRQNVMVELQEKMLEMFKPIFKDKIASLCTEVLSSAKSKIHDEVDKIHNLDESSVIDVIRPYMKEFDDKSLADHVHPYFQKVLGRHREKLGEDLTRIAEQEMIKIRIERSGNKEDIDKALGKFLLRVVTAPVTIPTFLLTGKDPLDKI